MIYKAVKLFVNFEKEEKWINEMAQKGMNFTYYTFLTYHFKEGTPGEYIYRTELLKEFPSHPESRAYIRFMEENGIECVSTYVRWAFFRKKASEGPFDIYSDTDSRITHYKRVATFFGIIGGANLIIFLSNFFNWLTFGYKHDMHATIIVSSLNLALGAGLMFLTSSYLRKVSKLKKDKQLFE